ncbi:MAG TPA: ABC transporter substrate-binding protein [Acidothermaceae bacterium]
MRVTTMSRRWLLAVSACTVLVVVAGCSSSKKTSGTTSTPPAAVGSTSAASGGASTASASTASASTAGSSAAPADTSAIKIAVIDAQSGQSSSLGKREYDGVKLAVDQANAAGGINGRKVELTVFDDQADPTVSTNLARKAVSGGFIAILGPAESADAIAMSPILQQAKIPYITSGQSPAMPKLGDPYLFLNSPTSTTYDTTLANYAVKTANFTHIAMITNNGAYGKGEHDAFTAALKALNVTPVTDQIVTPDQTDFSAALTSIRQKNPDALFIGAEEVESGLIVKQARGLGIKATIIGAAPTSTPIFVQTAGTANAEGAVSSTPYLTNDTNAQTKAFAAAYDAAYGTEPELHGAKAYDGAEIMLQALKTTNGAGGQALDDAIRAVKYQGLVGNFAFDATGVGVHETQIGIIKNGVLTAAS